MSMSGIITKKWQSNMSSFFSVKGSQLLKLHDSLSDLEERLDSRNKVPPAVFAQAMKLREDTHHLGKFAH